MCIPQKTDQPSSTTQTSARPIFGLGALMVVACVAGPFLAGLAGALVGLV